MRTLAIGDIHGCLTALRALLETVQLTANDRLVTLGDYVDRGPDSRGVLDYLVHLHRAGVLLPLRGNHDAMMLQARLWPEASGMWLTYGGRQTLASYDPEAIGCEALTKVPDEHWEFLSTACLSYFESERHIFVHANVVADAPMCEQPESVLMWEKLEEPIRHISGKVVVCGHTRQLEGVPVSWGTTICIDTGAYANDGWLTCLDVDRECYWQANELGEVRAGWLLHREGS